MALIKVQTIIKCYLKLLNNIFKAYVPDYVGYSSLNKICLLPISLLIPTAEKTLQ